MSKAGDWYNDNEKVIRWGTMLLSWGLGVTAIATGLGAPVGMAIITAGSGYAGVTSKPVKRAYSRYKTKKRVERAIANAGGNPENMA